MCPDDPYEFIDFDVDNWKLLPKPCSPPPGYRFDEPISQADIDCSDAVFAEEQAAVLLPKRILLRAS